MTGAISAEPCMLLEWDTTFWGFSTARVGADVLTRTSIAQIATWCGDRSIRCLYFLARADDAETTRLAEDNGFRLVDVRVTLQHDLSIVSRHEPMQSSSVKLRSPKPEDSETLKRVARHGHRDTRFYYDQHFARERCDDLYETWIMRSCDGYAEAVLVAEVSGRPAGYITCHTNDIRGSIGLLGVDEWARGQGVGQQLVLGAVDWFRERDIAMISVVTQARNRAAQRLYQRCGFMTANVELWYHKWLENRESIDR